MERYSTDSVRSQARLAFWNDVISDAFTGLCSIPRETGEYAAHLERVQLARLTLARATTMPAQVLHTQLHVRRTPERCLLLHFQMEGSCRFMQRSRSARLDSGDFVVADTAWPYEFMMDAQGGGAGHRMMVVRMPESLLGVRRNTIERACGITIPGGSRPATLLTSYLVSLWDWLQQEEASVPAPHAGQALVDLVELACVDGVMGLPHRKRSDIARDDVIQFILDRLYDPELSVGIIAASLRVTPRYVQKLFADMETTPRKYITDLRLQAAARALEDPARDHLAVSDIAFSVGFSDLSHFGRCFREIYGAPPVQFRRSRRPA